MHTEPLHVSILGLPDSAHSTVAGLVDTFNVFKLLQGADDAVPDTPPYVAEIVGLRDDDEPSMPFRIQRDIGDIARTDIVIIPALDVHPDAWQPGTRPDIVDWLKTVHANGTRMCSTCSGALLLADTGLLTGCEATTHWAYADAFRKHFPDVELRLERMLVQSGTREEFVMSGASGSWHDLALYLISHSAGLAAAQVAAKFLLLEWHVDGQMPFVIFKPPRDHGDAIVRDAQEWLDANLSVANPVESMTETAGLPARTFKRRFLNATGCTPMQYIQELRIDTAKRRLERSNTSIEEIAWRVGYEDPAFFRRLFKRITGISPSAYRRKLQLPAYATAKARPRGQGFQAT